MLPSLERALVKVCDFRRRLIWKKLNGELICCSFVFKALISRERERGEKGGGNGIERGGREKGGNEIEREREAEGVREKERESIWVTERYLTKANLISDYLLQTMINENELTTDIFFTLLNMKESNELILQNYFPAQKFKIENMRKIKFSSRQNLLPDKK